VTRKAQSERREAFACHSHTLVLNRQPPRNPFTNGTTTLYTQTFTLPPLLLPLLNSAIAAFIQLLLVTPFTRQFHWLRPTSALCPPASSGAPTSRPRHSERTRQTLLVLCCARKTHGSLSLKHLPVSIRPRRVHAAADHVLEEDREADGHHQALLGLPGHGRESEADGTVWGESINRYVCILPLAEHVYLPSGQHLLISGCE
jgi:hypothetical protein